MMSVAIEVDNQGRVWVTDTSPDADDGTRQKAKGLDDALKQAREILTLKGAREDKYFKRGYEKAQRARGA